MGCLGVSTATMHKKGYVGTYARPMANVYVQKYARYCRVGIGKSYVVLRKHPWDTANVALTRIVSHCRPKCKRRDTTNTTQKHTGQVPLKF